MASLLTVALLDRCIEVPARPVGCVNPRCRHLGNVLSVWRGIFKLTFRSNDLESPLAIPFHSAVIHVCDRPTKINRDVSRRGQSQLESLSTVEGRSRRICIPSARD